MLPGFTPMHVYATHCDESVINDVSQQTRVVCQCYENIKNEINQAIIYGGLC